MKWIPISELHEYVKGREMFVVKAFNVRPHELSSFSYTSDPYCVWHEENATDGHFVRWPHPFLPTHFCLLPTEK